MDYIYVIQEGFDVYPEAYTTYNQAVAAVKSKHKEQIDHDLQEASNAGFGPEEMTGIEVDVPESPTGKSHLFMESLKLNIFIMKLPVRKNGGRRKRTRRNH